VDKARKSLGKKSGATLGILRLDHDWEARVGDIHVEETWNYHVEYRKVKGLTLAMCEGGKMTPEVEIEFVKAIKELDAIPVSGITGDCGFMMWFQAIAREHTNKPVFMSPIAQLPSLLCCYDDDEIIAIISSNAKALEPMHDQIMSECGVETHDDRFFIAGCEDDMKEFGFDALERGEKVNEDAMMNGLLAKIQKLYKEHPGIRAILMECTELPPYSDLVRAEMGLPVYDCITCCDFFMSGFIDNPRFGLNDWQENVEETFSTK